MNHNEPQNIFRPSKTEKEFAALSYLWILSLFIYFSPESKSKFVRHHALQGVILFVLSILFSFLPGVLSYLNFLVLFLLVMGIVEAAQGNWYRLPLISDWLEGKFSVSHFAFVFHWWKKLKSLFVKDNQKPSFACLEHLEFLKGETRNAWKKDILYAEQIIIALAKSFNISMNKSDDMLELQQATKTIAYFGAVNDLEFMFVYPRSLGMIMGDENRGDWELKKFSIKTMDKEGFEALVKLVFSS